MRRTFFTATLMAAVALGGSPAVHAGEGHDHGEAAPVAHGPALPRFTAASETFELVGIVDGKRITLYLDRTTDNSPVDDAVIELDIGDTQLQASQHEDLYEVTLPAAPQAGVLPITASVTAGNEVDLLVGELDIHEEAHAAPTVPARGAKAYAGWAAAAVAALIALAFIGRRLLARRHTRVGAAA